MKKNSLSQAARRGAVPYILTAIFAAVVVFFIVLSIRVLAIPVFAACAISILEVALVALLRKVPVYIHGLAILVQLIVGFARGKAVFMILMCAIYALALIILTLWRDEEPESETAVEG